MLINYFHNVKNILFLLDLDVDFILFILRKILVMNNLFRNHFHINNSYVTFKFKVFIEIVNFTTIFPKLYNFFFN